MVQTESFYKFFCSYLIPALTKPRSLDLLLHPATSKTSLIILSFFSQGPEN